MGVGRGHYDSGLEQGQQQALWVLGVKHWHIHLAGNWEGLHTNTTMHTEGALRTLQQSTWMIPQAANRGAGLDVTSCSARGCQWEEVHQEVGHLEPGHCAVGVGDPGGASAGRPQGSEGP